MNLVERLKNFITKSRRVLLVASKPTPEEFKVSAKITGIGIVVVGIIGFLIFILFTLTPLSAIA